jgi:hypothetical protein
MKYENTEIFPCLGKILQVNLKIVKDKNDMGYVSPDKIINFQDESFEPFLKKIQENFKKIQALVLEQHPITPEQIQEVQNEIIVG